MQKNKKNTKTTPTTSDAMSEAERLEAHMRALEEKWRGVPAKKMWGILWHTAQALSDMMGECRTRYWDRKFDMEEDLTAGDILDQNARCMEDQLYAIATLARHCFLFEQG